MAQTHKENSCGSSEGLSADEVRVREACRGGQWSFTSRPLLHVHHTWVVERRALLGCDWTLLSSRRFGAPWDQDNDVTWTIGLEVDNSCARTSSSSSSLRAPESVRVCVAFGTSVPHKCLYFRATLRAQQEAVRAEQDDDEQEFVDDAELTGMKLASPNQRQHIGDLYLVASDPTLTLRVDIAYLCDPQEAKLGPAGVSLRVPACSLADDMEDLLQNGRLADAVIVAQDDGREWPIHKAVLSARSPVFAAMFEHEMSESKSNRVVVKDVSGDVLHQVLRYVYTGRLDHVRSLGVDMLAVAERYALPRLKALCEEELARSVAVDNALDVLATADLFDAAALRDAALQCVCSNIHCVLDSPAWTELVAARPHLLHQVLERCVNYART